MKIVDRAKDFNLCDAKVPTIHGKVDITLKNVKTGLVDRINGENTFQSATLQHWLRRYGDLNVVAGGNYDDMVGGILLFRDAIPVGNRYMPAGNVMVGHGYKGSVTQGTYPYLGTYNASDSNTEPDQVAIRQVWDFATNQANGQIGCVSLTSYTGGYAGYGGDSRFGGEYGGISIRSGQSSIESYDGVGNGGYYNGWLYSIDSYSDGVLKIKKTRKQWETGSVFREHYKFLSFDMSEVGNPWNLDFATPSKIVWGDVGGGIFRFTYTQSRNVASGADFYYYEFNCANETLTIKSVTNSSSDTLNVAYDAILFFDDFMFVPSGSGTTNCYIFNCTTSELVDIVRGINSWRSPYDTTDRGDWDNMVGQLSDGLFLFSTFESGYSGRTPKIYDIVNKTLKNINFSSGMGSSGQTYGIGTRLKTLDGLMAIRMYYRPYRFHNPLHLATIYNLQSPVTKTPAQTMKVSYTLTEV